jgi:hypothetical protein
MAAPANQRLSFEYSAKERSWTMIWFSQWETMYLIKEGDVAFLKSFDTQ